MRTFDFHQKVYLVCFHLSNIRSSTISPVLDHKMYDVHESYQYVVERP